VASLAERAARWRVPLHFLLAALLLVLARPAPRLLTGGAALVLAGLVVRAWAAGHLRKDEPLTVSGPYAHVRHPLYAGTLLMLVGFGVASNSALMAVLIAAYFPVFFLPAMRREERERLVRAPELYPAYTASVPMLWPRLRPARFGAESQKHFDARTYLANREWRAAVSCALLLGGLYARMVLR